MTQPAWALDRTPRHPVGTPDAIDEALGTGRGGRIRCPSCSWQPLKRDRWFCNRCNRGHWNTFETRGVCPECSYHWTWTACLSCREWSLHEDWYEKPVRAAS